MSVPMNAETRKALDESIEVKWSGDVVDDGADNCPLCEIFNTSIGCGECPVKLRTSKSFCLETPYIEWQKHHETAHPINAFPIKMVKGCAECVRLRDAERAFLVSLRPKENLDGA